MISLASRFQKVEDSLTSKVVLGETQFNNLMRLMTKTNDSQVNETLSAYATFMRAFRNIHEKSVLFLISHWPAVKNKTRSLLTHVGLDGVSDISNTSDSVSSGYPNTEKRVENTTYSGVFFMTLEVFG